MGKNNNDNLEQCPSYSSYDVFPMVSTDKEKNTSENQQDTVFEKKKVHSSLTFNKQNRIKKSVSFSNKIDLREFRKPSESDAEDL